MKNILKYRKETCISIFLALIIVCTLQNFFIIGTIPSESMSPTLCVGDKVFIRTHSYTIERGKIYSFKKDGKSLIKRCIAVGGDNVLIHNNDVSVNGIQINEDYVLENNQEDNEVNNKNLNLNLTVPDGYVFFLGDNRIDSLDARYWSDKFIAKDDIKGKAERIIYPFNRSVVIS